MKRNDYIQLLLDAQTSKVSFELDTQDIHTVLTESKVLNENEKKLTKSVCN